MRRVIVNSTPFIGLCNINQLGLLKALYGKITIPAAVFKEVTEKQDSACVQMNEDRKMYKAKLHAGEVEVMILAQQKPQADLVIIDDNAAKKTAKYLGLRVTGTLGVLIKAKKQGMIQELRPYILSLKEKGFFVSEAVMNMALKAADE